MKNFLLKRILQMIFVFILVSMFAFAIIYFAPGDPLYMYTSPGKSSFKMSEEQLDALREDLGLTGNVVHQYTSWAKKTLTGDWGISLNNFLPVRPQIMERLPGTVGLWRHRLCYPSYLRFPWDLRQARIRTNGSIILSAASVISEFRFHHSGSRF